ncbi:butyrophilin subfamily 2 member A2-like isoform X2 [Hyperolius riggenbachi]|uniref:butyrophilin subfamily 2 member A2-like isoform X2 n=1 Tax=Hyperolius riggenbachi TaxID=752182 RepID=UPI0035A2B977
MILHRKAAMMLLCLAMLIFLQSCNYSTAATFTVHSQVTSVIASVGEDLVIGCYLTPEINAENMEVRWIRTQDGSVIHLYRNGKDETQNVDKDFKGRTEFIKSGIKRGQVSLRIQNIRPSDGDLYTCYFQNENMFDEATIEILPAALGTSPFLHIEYHSQDLMSVVCSSSGWYPKPEAYWLDEKNEALKDSTSEITNENQTYSITTSILYRKKSNKTSCIIQNSRPRYQRTATIQISVDVTLDPETAHKDLEVSEDLKCLSRASHTKDVQMNDRRFDTRLYVLGKEPLSNDKNYWLLNVNNAKHWTVGIARRNIVREGKLNLSPKNGFWVIERHEEILLFSAGSSTRQPRQMLGALWVSRGPPVTLSDLAPRQLTKRTKKGHQIYYLA